MDKLNLLTHFRDFLSVIINNPDENKHTINSIFNLLKLYEEKRIDINSNIFDPDVFLKQNAIVKENYSSSEELNDSEDSEIELYKNTKYKYELEQFLESIKSI